jgi:hypothetical protein
MKGLHGLLLAPNSLPIWKVSAQKRNRVNKRNSKLIKSDSGILFSPKFMILIDNRKKKKNPNKR